METFVYFWVLVLRIQSSTSHTLITHFTMVPHHDPMQNLGFCLLYFILFSRREPFGKFIHKAHYLKSQKIRYSWVRNYEYLEGAICVMCGSCGWQIHMCEHEDTKKCKGTRGYMVSSPPAPHPPPPVPTRQGSLSLEVGWHQQASGILSSRPAPRSGVTDACMAKLSFLYWGWGFELRFSASRAST